MSDFKSLFEDLKKQAKSKDVLMENLLKKITALEEAVRLNNKHTYGSKSRKRKSRQKNEDVDDDHTRNKTDFDRTQDSIRAPHAFQRNRKTLLITNRRIDQKKFACIDKEKNIAP